MPVPGGAKSSDLPGGVSARPARARPAIGDYAPPVRDGLIRLLQDVDAVRGEPLPMRRRSAEDDATATQPCLDRDGFVRELARIVSFVERYGVPASVIYLQVEKLPEIAERHGAEAEAAAIARVGDTLAAQVRATDHVGRLSSDGFGVVLAKANAAEAAAKAEQLTGLVRASPLVWKGRAVQLAVAAGVQALSA